MFDLQRRDGMLVIRENVVKGLSLEVGNTDRFCDTLVYEGFHLFPGFADGDACGRDGLAVFEPPALNIKGCALVVCIGDLWEGVVGERRTG